MLPVAVFLAAAVSLFDPLSTASGLSVTLALVAAGYGGLAWRFGCDLAEFAAVSSSLMAAGLALYAVGVPNAWLAGCLAVLAAAYAVAGRWRSRTAVRRGVRLGWYAAAGLLAGVALLLAAWAVLLLSNDVAQPQWYAIPAGLYLTGVGFLERRVGRKPLALIIEALGLAVLLVATFSQSLDGGAAGLPYFILLIVEAMGAMTWGALRRLKSPFFIGLAANVINVLAQLALLFAGPSTLIRWLIIGGTGLFIVAAAVFVERQRERLVARAVAWREALAAWD